MRLYVRVLIGAALLASLVIGIRSFREVGGLPLAQDSSPTLLENPGPIPQSTLTPVPDGTPETLAAAGDPESVSHLIRSLEQQSDPGEAGKLRQILGQVRNPASHDLLFGHYLNHDNPDVQDGARMALTAMAPPWMIQTWVAKHQDADTVNAKRIESLIAHVVSEEAFPTLENLAAGSAAGQTDGLMKSAIAALANAGTPYCVAAIARCLDQAEAEEDIQRLSEAMLQIRRPGSDHELAGIARGRQDAKKVSTRTAAIRALSQFTTPLARKTLEELALDGDPEVAAAAHESLRACRSNRENHGTPSSK